jgi:hypothetical protein
MKTGITTDLQERTFRVTSEAIVRKKDEMITTHEAMEMFWSLNSRTQAFPCPNHLFSFSNPGYHSLQ